MGLRDPLPKYVSWITRIIGYSIAAVVIVMAWFFTANIRLATHYTECMESSATWGDSRSTAMERAKALVSCVDERAGIVEAMHARSTKKMFDAFPSTPCNYVGTWNSVRLNSIYRITLSANGQFTATPIETSDRDAMGVTGSWSVTGSGDSQKMVWLYNEGQIWPPDINPVENLSASSFTLTEKNGTQSKFSRTDTGDCSEKR